MIGEFAEDVFILFGEDFVVGVSFSGFVVDLEDADDLGVVHDGNGEDAPEWGFEAFLVAF